MSSYSTRAARPVDLSGWRLANAVSFTIPNGTMLGSGQYLLISQHPGGAFQPLCGVLSLGPFEGRLSNDGETVQLLNTAGVVQDEVDYQLGFPWPTIGDIPAPIDPAHQSGIRERCRWQSVVRCR